MLHMFKQGKGSVQTSVKYRCPNCNNKIRRRVFRNGYGFHRCEKCFLKIGYTVKNGEVSIVNN